MRTLSDVNFTPLCSHRDLELGHYCRFIFIYSKKCKSGQRPRPEKSLPSAAKRVLESRLSMANFAKNEDCPASVDLLAFQNGDLAVSESAGIRRHLAECDFCASEVEFYSHYPQPAEGASEAAPPAEIPSSLFELAEAILKKS